MSPTKKNDEKVVVNILWTGGWDSTFRIMQLSTKNIVIQPFYLSNHRKSEDFELKSIVSLTKNIRNLSSTKCTLCELIKINVSEINEEKNIIQSFKDISISYKKLTKIQLGCQYEWLAQTSLKNNKLELSVEKGSKLIDYINAYGGLKKVIDKIKGEYYVINKSISSIDVINVFGNFHFPLIDYSKLDMKQKAKESGFFELMNKTWFCHNPIDKQPCGLCNPCKQTIESGLDYRFSKAALKRYKMKKLIRPIKNTSIIKAIGEKYRIFLAKKISTTNKSYL